MKDYTRFKVETIMKWRKYMGEISKSSSLEHWVNFHQTWHKASLVEGINVCSNKGPPPFPREDTNEIAKLH